MTRQVNSRRRPGKHRLEAVRALLRKADIQVFLANQVSQNAQQGLRSWDIVVADPRFFDRLLDQGSLGAGESYMEGWWDVADGKDLDGCLRRVFYNELDEDLKRNWVWWRHLITARLMNMQTRRRAARSAKAHYDLSNEFYEKMLGETMAYTCGYWVDDAWDTPSDLDAAQTAKFDLICRKLQLDDRRGQWLLDLGCGFGGLAEYAASTYGCNVVGVNVSEAQIDFARNRRQCTDGSIEFHNCNYTEHKVYNPQGRVFDKVVSVGLGEHVGPKNYRVWLETAHRQLADGGLFLNHSIGSDESRSVCDPFTDKYIFPNSVLPSIKQLGGASEGLFVWEDLQNFGLYYYKTARAWYENFAANWTDIQGLNPRRFDNQFFRLWTFYLKAAMAMAESRDAQLWQIVMSKKGRLGLYHGVR